MFSSVQCGVGYRSRAQEALAVCCGIDEKYDKMAAPQYQSREGKSIYARLFLTKFYLLTFDSVFYSLH